MPGQVVTLILLAALMAPAAIAPAVLAQDVTAPATYGEAYLSAGFTPDPHRVPLTAGGDIDAAASIGGGCIGHIARAPDFDLYYNAGTLPLIISVGSGADTTLAVNAPDGSWYCDDDGGDGLNPSVRFSPPQTGVYDIWVGTVLEAQPAPAVLTISELHSQ